MGARCSSQVETTDRNIALAPSQTKALASRHQRSASRRQGPPTGAKRDFPVRASGRSDGKSRPDLPIQDGKSDRKTPRTTSISSGSQFKPQAEDFHEARIYHQSVSQEKRPSVSSSGKLKPNTDKVPKAQSCHLPSNREERPVRPHSPVKDSPKKSLLQKRSPPKKKELIPEHTSVVQNREGDRRGTHQRETCSRSQQQNSVEKDIYVNSGPGIHKSTDFEPKSEEVTIQILPLSAEGRRTRIPVAKQYILDKNGESRTSLPNIHQTVENSSANKRVKESHSHGNIFSVSDCKQREKHLANRVRDVKSSSSDRTVLERNFRRKERDASPTRRDYHRSRSLDSSARRGLQGDTSLVTQKTGHSKSAQHSGDSPKCHQSRSSTLTNASGLSDIYCDDLSSDSSCVSDVSNPHVSTHVLSNDADSSADRQLGLNEKQSQWSLSRIRLAADPQCKYSADL